MISLRTVSLWLPGALLLLGLPAVLPAADEPGESRQTVISLDAQASRDVPNDLMRVSFFVEMEDTDPARLARDLNASAEKAVAAARTAKDVRVETSGYQTYPVRDKSNRIARWRSRYDFTVESRDFDGLSELTGRLQALAQVSGLSFTVAPDTRAKAEEALIEEAVAAFRRRAALIARSAGLGDYRIREMAVHSDGFRPPPAPRMVMMAEAAAPPVEGGVTSITLRISGSIQSRGAGM